jgi:hypothetical protein
MLTQENYYNIAFLILLSTCSQQELETGTLGMCKVLWNIVKLTIQMKCQQEKNIKQQ